MLEFDPLDAAVLRQLNFSVGVFHAMRLTGSKLFFVYPDGSWRASHLRNNISLAGMSTNPVKAYRIARDTLDNALIAGGSPYATKQA